MDVDTTTRKGSHERLLTAFGEGKADILLGTQMIAKGLDFPEHHPCRCPQCGYDASYTGFPGCGEDVPIINPSEWQGWEAYPSR